MLLLTSWLEPTRQWLLLLAAVLTLATAIWKGRWLFKKMKTTWHHLTGVGSLSAQLTAVREQLTETATTQRETLAALREIREQLRPNGGTSLHDVVHAMAAAQRARDDREAAPLFWTDATGRVTHANRAFQQLTGCTATELLGSGWVNCVAVEDRERVLDLWRDAVHDNRDLDDRFRLRDGTDRLRAVALHACRLRDHTGRLLGYYGEVRPLD